MAGDVLDTLIRVALREDLGLGLYDATTDNLEGLEKVATARVRARKPGVLAGLAVLEPIARVFDAGVRVRLIKNDGAWIDPDQTAAELIGPLSAILKMERTALNFVTHLSGVATLTRRFVDEVVGTKAKIYDTRKTLPGLRGLQKYAVACGGGHNHRRGLYDAVLVKDNHLAGVGERDWPGRVLEAIKRARGRSPKPTFVEVEVDRVSQLEALLGQVRNPLEVSLDVVLLDNMMLEELRRAVEVRDQVAPGVELEASGGVNLETVRRIAYTGVERIAVGALTHSAAALDLGLDLLPPEAPEPPEVPPRISLEASTEAHHDPDRERI